MSEKKITRVEQGQLYQVTTVEFLTTGQHNSLKRPVFLKKGEIIEIRFAYEWHFRTEDDQYFHAEETTILDNCKLLGKIYDPVFFANKAKLADIVRLQLYNKPSCNPVKEK